MADYILRGTKKLVAYKRSLNVNVTNEQMAAAIGNLTVIDFASGGRDESSFVSARYSEKEAQALAGLLGVSVANVTTNGGQEVVG